LPEHPDACSSVVSTSASELFSTRDHVAHFPEQNVKGRAFEAWWRNVQSIWT